MKDLKRISLIALTLVLLAACGSKTADKKTENAPKEELIELTQQQFKTSGMELGEPSI